MKPRATPLALPLLALAVLAGASGCADNASVEVQAICNPTDDCTFAGKCDTQYIGYPTLDLETAVASRLPPNADLWLMLQVSNQLPNNASADRWRVNTNDAHVDTTTIEYEGAKSGTQEIGSNYLVPANSTSVVSVKLNLTGAVATAVGAMVVAHVRLSGYFDDGTRFETGDFPIAVVVCAGCASEACGTGVSTCPPNSEGQTPLTCGTPPPAPTP